MTEDVAALLQAARALAGCDHRDAYYTTEPSGGHSSSSDCQVCEACGAKKSRWGGWRHARKVQALLGALERLA